jgi:hypothetical protein
MVMGGLSIELIVGLHEQVNERPARRTPHHRCVVGKLPPLGKVAMSRDCNKGVSRIRCLSNLPYLIHGV